MDRYQTTFKTWDKLASLYQEKFMDLDLYNDSYDLFCKLFAQQHPAILEIGCGPGNITQYVLSARPGFNIMGIDVSPNMITLAKQNNPAAEFSIMDCREIDRIQKSFDGIICGFCIPYLSKEDCSKLFKDSFHLLKTGGYFYFSAIEGTDAQSGYEAGSTGHRAYVYYYDDAYFKQALAENHFTPVHTLRKNYTKADGSVQVHLVYIAQKDQ